MDRIDNINIVPGRITLLPFQSAPLTLVVTTSHGDPASPGSLTWSTTGGTVINNGIIGGVPHITYTAPSQAGSYQLIVTTVTGTPTATASITVTLTAVPVSAVTVTPGSVSLALADTTTLQAKLADSTGNVIFGRAIDWTTSDAGVATVLATGFVRAIAAGSATITATSEGHSGTAVVTVRP
ncbi:MAG TPA: Ig-like domain-containing protein [Gemmatimonadales bacterium]|nr:Ig-like domain-containing protein [Gemmatimonadales bacterium]